MSYLSTSSASVDTADWSVLGVSYADAGAAMSHGGTQLARLSATFSVASATATIGVALVSTLTGEVYQYREAFAVAGDRRQGGNNLSGNYIGRLDFESGTAPTAYAASYQDKVDLMHGEASDYGLDADELEWRFGVTAISAGTVNVTAVGTRVI